MKRINHRTMHMQIWARIFCLVVFLSVFLNMTWAFGKETSMTADLTEQEKLWIVAHPAIRLAPDPEFRPIEFIDEKGDYVGMAADYARLIGQKLGIKFEIVRCNNWDDVIARTKRREVDVLNAVVKTPQREAYLRFPVPYLKIPSVIIVRKNVERRLTLDMLKGMTLVMVSGYGYIDFIRNQYPHLKIDLASDLKTALRKVSFGLADAFVGDLATASYYIEAEGITNLRLAGETEQPNISGFAVRSDWPELSRILDKGVSMLTEEEKKGIYRKWVRLESEPTLPIREFRNLMLIIAGILVLAGVGFAFWHRTLRRLVNLRTEDLQNELGERKRAEDALRESEERFRRIFDEGPFGMALINPDATIIAANKVLCDLLGYTEQELAGQGVADITCEEDQEKSGEFSRQLFAGSIPVLRLEKRYVRKDGSILWSNSTISAIHGKEDNVLYGLAIIEDITESRKAAEKIHLLAYYDSLTGFPNRTFHKELLIRSIEHAQRHKEIFALIYIGLDNLKRINDSLGYSLGDLLLKAFSDRLTSFLSKSEHGPGPDEHVTVNVISRVGGDEFVVLMHDLNQAEDAARTARRFLEELSSPYDLSGREVFITVSIGIALYPDDGTEVDDLLKNAEKAMRHTKSEGKNNYHFYSGSMNSFVLELMTLENELHRALERNELALYYQPKVDAATRKVTGMEALIRWNHPDKGLIPPMQFIPMAETSGLILPIGEFVIRSVCKQIKTWQDAGYQQMNIALNVSGRQFDQQNLIEVVREALRDNKILPQCLELEITESTLMRDPEKIIRTLTELKAMGIRIAVDDFGTGYSSLSYLKRLPLDFLKIDRSFVNGLVSDPRDQAIVRTMIVMAHSLNLKTIAEGVETDKQLTFLQEHGCDEIQGYLFSRPLPPEEIPGILARGYL